MKRILAEPEVRKAEREPEASGRDGAIYRSIIRDFTISINILAAYSAARTGGMELKNFAQVLQDFNPQNGRMEQFHIGNTDVILNLAKNPAGFNQNISAVMEDKREKI